MRTGEKNNFLFEVMCSHSRTMTRGPAMACHLFSRDLVAVYIIYYI